MRVLILSIVISFTASASFFKEVCSSADQSFYGQSGHVVPKKIISYRDIRTGDMIEINLDVKNLKERVIENSILKNSSKVSCDSSRRDGFIVWNKLSLKHLSYKKKDGKNFRAGIPGLSPSKKVLKVTVLCKETGNSRTTCN